MFGKIRNKLKGIFEKTDEIIKEDNNLDSEEILIQDDEENNEEKPTILNKLFSKKKDEHQIKEVEQLEDIMLEDVNDSEKKAIENKKQIPKSIVKKRIDEVEKEFEKEENNEKETLNEINNSENKVETKSEPKIDEIPEEIEEDKKEGFFSKTFKKLKSKVITEEDFDNIWLDLEIFLLEINVAFEIVEKIQNELKKELISNSFDRFKLNEKIREVMSNEVEKVLISREDDLISKIKKLNENGEIAKIIMLGVNGTGKTTTIAKFVNFLQKENLKVVVAAADTFRAAATEQLEEHSKKLNFKLIMHKGGSDPAAVAFDAVEHAKAKKLDVVLIDTAGRMPNNSNLMVELQKIKRVVNSQLAIFVGDSISGNDLIEQVNLFDKGINIDGIILTKVDTDERPGSIVTCAYTIDKPIFFLGVGQNYNDLIKFDAKLIANKLFDTKDDE